MTQFAAIVDSENLQLTIGILAYERLRVLRQCGTGERQPKEARRRYRQKNCKPASKTPNHQDVRIIKHTDGAKFIT